MKKRSMALRRYARKVRDRIEGNQAVPPRMKRRSSGRKVIR